MRDCAPAFARVRVYVCLFRRARARVGWCKLYESPGGNQVDGLPPAPVGVELVARGRVNGRFE